MERFDLDQPPPPMPQGMTWAQFESRARAEGIWQDVQRAGVIASMAGVEVALHDVALPDWAGVVVRSQFPAVPPQA